MHSMRILGIDPGLRCTGFGVIDAEGSRLHYVASGTIKTDAVAIGFIAGACGNFGEFVMKALKRDAGVRSWGGRASVTGAVGLLDRVAPLCFAAPVFFHAVRWYLGN